MILTSVNAAVMTAREQGWRPDGITKAPPNR